VFVECARQAHRLARHPALVGWLYATTRLTALRMIRTEQRRSAREQKALAMNELLRESAPEPDWDRLRPILEDAMHELGEKDRLAVLLRYFQNQNLQDVGTALDLGENAARMRVDRALEKLRGILLKRGVATSSTLAALISANAVQMAPSGLAASFAAASTASAGVGTITFLKIMTATQIKIGASILAVALAITALVVQHQAQARLRADNEALQRELAQFATDYAALSNRLASVREPAKLPAAQMQELLKLRGEMGLLKRRSAAAQAWASSGGVQPHATADPDAPKQAAIRRMDGAMKLVAAALNGFDQNQDGDFPTNWNQTVAAFDKWELKDLKAGDPIPDTAADFNALTNAYDLVYQGSLNNLFNSTNLAAIIVVREQQAQQAADGSWNRTYGFADGHSEVYRSVDGDFSGWESQHAMGPSGGP
jgi:RNA polymerase sigma factor (sigma-70 family)